MSVTLRVPASSANIGPGFDTLGMAISQYLDFTFDSVRVSPDGPDSAIDHCDEGSNEPTDEHHLAVRTFRAAGGTGAANVKATFPGGRGLGFSGSARVAGVAAAALQRGEPLHQALMTALKIAGDLEGHRDNVAASVYGGVVAAAGNTVVKIPLGFNPAIVLWIPATETSTKQSRTSLPDRVNFEDAIFNVGRAATLVAAFAAGDAAALRVACEDRLHQSQRFAQTPESEAAYHSLLRAGAWCAWLSGSGPSVAALCAPDAVDAMITALPSTGRSVRATIDTEGTRLL